MESIPMHRQAHHLSAFRKVICWLLVLYQAAKNRSLVDRLSAASGVEHRRMLEPFAAAGHGATDFRRQAL
jgi:hypothetical protein